MIRREFESADDMWFHALEDALTGVRGDDQDEETFEETAWATTIANPHRCFTWNPNRMASPIRAAGELLWHLSGTDDGEFITHYSKDHEKFLSTLADGSRIAEGASGARWAHSSQLECVEKALSVPDSNQAIMTCWDPGDLVLAGARANPPDIPRTLSLQFLRRQTGLSLIVTMRSSDAWEDMPNDVFRFCALLCIMADRIGERVDRYHHQVGSLYLRVQDEEKAASVVTSSYSSLPGICHTDEGDIDHALEIEKRIRCGSDPVAAICEMSTVSSLIGTIAGQLAASAICQSMSLHQLSLVHDELLQFMSQDHVRRIADVLARREAKCS